MVSKTLALIGLFHYSSSGGLFAVPAVSPCMGAALVMHVAFYVFLWKAEEERQFISKCNVNIVCKICIFKNLFLH